MDWTNMYKKYKGLWVALKSDHKTIVASAKTAKEALKKAEKKGFKHPFLNYVPKKMVTFAGLV